MQQKVLDKRDGARSFLLIYGRGETVMQPLREFLKAEAITAASLSGIGALECVTLGYFDWETKEYEEHRIDEQVELLSLVGDVAVDDGKPQVHAHAVIGLRDTTARGGHLLDATVRPTLELIVQDVPAHLRRVHDPESGLALIAPHV